MVGAPQRDLAGEQRDHATASALRSGAPLAWQIATASASAAWSGLRQRGQREQRLDHPLHLVLRRAAGAADRALDLLRRVGGHGDAALAGGQQDDAAGLADRERRVRVGAEVELLDRHRVRRVLGQQLAHARVDRGQPARQREPRADVSITPPSSATRRPP